MLIQTTRVPNIVCANAINLNRVGRVITSKIKTVPSVPYIMPAL